MSGNTAWITRNIGDETLQGLMNDSVFCSELENLDEVAEALQEEPTFRILEEPPSVSHFLRQPLGMQLLQAPPSDDDDLED